MPISSGALGWPNSYFRKPEADEDSTTFSNGEEYSGKPTNGYAWTIQLSDRADYERWKKDFDAKEAKRLAKERKRKEKKRRKELRRLEKQAARDNVEVVLSRQRRRRCLLLSLCVCLLLTMLLLGAVELYTYYLEEDDLGPPVLFNAECKGRWRTHFLGYSAPSPNGTIYYCCYLPDVNSSYRSYTLNKGNVWPDGFVIPKAACPTNHGNCEYFEKNNLFSAGTPPCSSGNHMTFYPVLIGFFYCGILLLA